MSDAPAVVAPPAAQRPGKDVPGSVRILSAEQIRASYGPLRRGDLAPGSLPVADLPLRVVPAGEDVYEILDGFKRFHRWIEAGYTRVPVIIEAPMSSADHKRLLLVANAPVRTITPMDEALVVQSLMDDEHRTANATARLLGRKPRWVAGRLRFARRLSADAQSQLAQGRIGPALATALTALPAVDQDRLLEAIHLHHLRATDGAVLVAAYRAADETDRQTLLRSPAATLHPEPSPMVSPRAAELEGRLESFRRLLADLRMFAWPDDLPPPEQRRLEALHRSVIQDLLATARAVTPDSPITHPTAVQEICHESEHTSEPNKPDPDRDRYCVRQAPKRISATSDRNTQAPSADDRPTGRTRGPTGHCPTAHVLWVSRLQRCVA
jgi:ParB-like chromosome segregation protein Spo0J